ncbi:hypothetical protein Droror1_Dr00012768 [Drosera rotundifolia]
MNKQKVHLFNSRPIQSPSPLPFHASNQTGKNRLKRAIYISSYQGGVFDFSSFVFIHNLQPLFSRCLCVPSIHTKHPFENITLSPRFSTIKPTSNLSGFLPFFL